MPRHKVLLGPDLPKLLPGFQVGINQEDKAASSILSFLLLVKKEISSPEPVCLDSLNILKSKYLLNLASNLPLCCCKASDTLSIESDGHHESE